jgi:(1->4)-alpha-D-glucan 1-alpha-D-glucosylmutase
MLAAVADADAGTADPSATSELDAIKLLVTSRALRLRRDHRDWFDGSYEPVQASGPAGTHAVAFSRAGQAVTVATRLPGGLRRAGGWRDSALAVPAGRWRDVLTGAEHRSAAAGQGSGQQRGRIQLAELLCQLPVALLVRAEDDTANLDLANLGPGAS